MEMSWFRTKTRAKEHRAIALYEYNRIVEKVEALAKYLDVKFDFVPTRDEPTYVSYTTKWTVVKKKKTGKGKGPKF